MCHTIYSLFVGGLYFLGFFGGFSGVFCGGFHMFYVKNWQELSKILDL